MTIILAISTKNGLILASDGQITSGEIRTYGKKIKKLNNYCLWGAAGREALIQRVEEKLINAQFRDRSLKEIRDELAKIIKNSVTELFHLDGQPPQEDFLFAEYRDKPLILHITISGTPEWIKTGVFGIGIGRVFVHALLEKYRKLIPEKIDLEKGSLLAFKIIEEAIEVGAYGVGLPIDIWQITSSGLKNLSEDELSALKNKCSQLRDMEIKMLLESKDESFTRSQNQTSSRKLAK